MSDLRAIELSAVSGRFRILSAARSTNEGCDAEQLTSQTFAAATALEDAAPRLKLQHQGAADAPSSCGGRRHRTEPSRGGAQQRHRHHGIVHQDPDGDFTFDALREQSWLGSRSCRTRRSGAELTPAGSHGARRSRK